MAMVLDQVKKIAPTNKAALNLKGSTIHKFLNMDIEGNVSTKKMNYIKNNVKYIFVDEISMITKELWRRLAFVKQATGIKFLLIGDDKQLPPVEDDKVEDYFNHPAVKYLCNNNRNNFFNYVINRNKSIYNVFFFIKVILNYHHIIGCICYNFISLIS